LSLSTILTQDPLWKSCLVWSFFDVDFQKFVMIWLWDPTFSKRFHWAAYCWKEWFDIVLSLLKCWNEVYCMFANINRFPLIRVFTIYHIGLSISMLRNGIKRLMYKKERFGFQKCFSIIFVLHIFLSLI